MLRILADLKKMPVSLILMARRPCFFVEFKCKKKKNIGKDNRKMAKKEENHDFMNNRETNETSLVKQRPNMTGSKITNVQQQLFSAPCSKNYLCKFDTFFLNFFNLVTFFIAFIVIFPYCFFY